MHASGVVVIFLLACVALFASHWIITFFHWVVMSAIHKYRKVDCECRTPKHHMIGEVFVCPECLWKWYVWWDDWSTGWGWMPYWEKILLKVGLIPQKCIREEDPPPVLEPEIVTARGRLARLEQKFRNRVNR